MISDARQQRLCKGQAGSAAIEFGLAVPLLLALLMGVVELGFAMVEIMQVHSAAEAGAVYAAKNGWDAAGIGAAVANATGNTGLTATPSPTHFWGCPSESGIIAVASSSVNCADGNASGEYVRISASLDRSTILPYPGFSLPATFTANSVVRLN